MPNMAVFTVRPSQLGSYAMHLSTWATVTHLPFRTGRYDLFRQIFISTFFSQIQLANPPWQHGARSSSVPCCHAQNSHSFTNLPHMWTSITHACIRATCPIPSFAIQRAQCFTASTVQQYNSHRQRTVLFCAVCFRPTRLPIISLVFKTSQPYCTTETTLLSHPPSYLDPS